MNKEFEQGVPNPLAKQPKLGIFAVMCCFIPIVGLIYAAYRHKYWYYLNNNWFYPYQYVVGMIVSMLIPILTIVLLK